jgi:enoyl-CoA hydratase/carnithine racemase
VPAPYQRLHLSRVIEDERVAVLELRRPPVNAFDAVFKHELIEVARDLVAAAEVRALVVHGGERFSAGDDIKEMDEDELDDGQRGLELISEACSAIAELPMPVVAAVRGFALGGGCELALACDFRVSAPDAQWGLPEVHLGLIPGGGGTQRLARLLGPARAKWMILLGEAISGDDAHELGLVDVVAPDGEVLTSAVRLARTIADRAPHAVRAAKLAVDRGLDLDLADGLALESRLAIDVFDTDDAREGLANFLARPRRPDPRDG